MFRFVKMNMPEPRLIVENFGGFVVEKVKLELVAVVIVEPMGEVNEDGIEFASFFVGLIEKFDAVNEANLESSKDSKDAFLSNIGKDMRNDYRGILRIKAEVSCFLLFWSERRFAITSNRSFRSVKQIGIDCGHSPIDLIHAKIGIDHGSCVESACRLAARNALGVFVIVIEIR